MGHFVPAVKYVLSNENGLIENAKDPGSINNHGISLRFLRTFDTEKLKSYGIFEEPNDKTVRELTVEQAEKIYHQEYWLHTRFQEIHDQYLCNYLFDMAVNMGISPTIKALQRACWSACNAKNFIKDDGILGEQTIRCVNMSSKIFAALRSERAADYKLTVAYHPEQREFLESWLVRAYEK